VGLPGLLAKLLVHEGPRGLVQADTSGAHTSRVQRELMPPSASLTVVWNSSCSRRSSRPFGPHLFSYIPVLVACQKVTLPLLGGVWAMSLAGTICASTCQAGSHAPQLMPEAPPVEPCLTTPDCNRTAFDPHHQRLLQLSSLLTKACGGRACLLHIAFLVHASICNACVRFQSAAVTSVQ
jgi:hypothetical protein